MLKNTALRLKRAPNVSRLVSKRSFGVLGLIQLSTESIQQLHTMSGLPWYIFIPLTTFTLRSCITLPLAVWNRKRLQKQNRLRPLINSTRPVVRFRLALQQQLQQQRTASPTILPKENLDYDKVMILSTKEVRRRQKKLFQKEGIQIWKNFVLPLTQVPLWVTMSMTFRNLTGWRTELIPGSSKVIDQTLSLEGIPSLIPDLTVPDPYHVMPLLLGLLALSNVEWNNKTIQLMDLTNKGKKLSFRPTIFDSMINISRYSTIFLIAMSIQAPAALSLYWVSSNLFSLLQNILMDKLLPLNYTPYLDTNFTKLAKDSIPLIKGV